MAEASTPQVYHGSCHCGDVKYQLRLALPPASTPNPFAHAVRLYRCNCSACHKMGMFHCRPVDGYEDFVLTSPSTIEELGDYRAFSGRLGWYFCKKCGVRTFGMGGEWVQEELDVDKWAGREGTDGTPQKVWRLKQSDSVMGYGGKPLHIVTVNAVTLEGVDLIEWKKKNWIFYCENVKRTEDTPPGEGLRFGEPFPGGYY